MKKLLLIPVLALVCVACDDSNYNRCAGMQSQESSADWEITTKVKAQILSDSSISGSARFVSVSTINGVVYLSGSVSSRADRDRIVKIAQNVRGVVRVDNQMTVK